ncbi:hypothetical protein [Micrococcus sp.]|uniref:hypothetical protein n=1 Tax=Micrococcus sp. TaxID=1271 RepID=UPI002A90D56F|nr:hypothetical protein [Micrococcus sp.]MDY6055800.1 hypothetical protein [Micrococcus sp.]
MTEQPSSHDAAPAPPSHEMLPLITLAVEHVFDTLTREPAFTPTLLAVTADDQRGMWPIPELTPENAAEAVGAISPTPARAVAVFDGEVQTPLGPRLAIAIEAFDASRPRSTRLVVEYARAVPGTDLGPRLTGEPQVVAEGPNPLAPPPRRRYRQEARAARAAAAAKAQAEAAAGAGAPQPRQER